MAAKFDDAWFVKAMVKATADMWEKGWDERNGGNVSLRLLPEDVAAYATPASPRRLVLSEPLPEIAGQHY
ncbi:class II aldolase/adducin family protein, partial [Mycobacterium tuberculosis]|nr:class II aldolase/adducin family protein [Mycobacterium tuberculosis]